MTARATSRRLSGCVKHPAATIRWIMCQDDEAHPAKIHISSSEVRLSKQSTRLVEICMGSLSGHVDRPARIYTPRAWRVGRSVRCQDSQPVLRGSAHIEGWSQRSDRAQSRHSTRPAKMYAAASCVSPWVPLCQDSQPVVLGSTRTDVSTAGADSELSGQLTRPAKIYTQPKWLRRVNFPCQGS